MHDIVSLHKTIQACTRCPLWKTRTQTVPGEGNIHTSILFVGEAPGKQEDLKGKPFVGASGKLLDVLLESISLTRNDIFITNTLKCRPPDNRDPKTEESIACKSFLDAQIQLLSPKVIVPLGRYALRYFFPDANIQESHGKLFVYNTLPCIPLYHPAAALYNGSLRKTLFLDIQQLIPYIT